MESLKRLWLNRRIRMVVGTALGATLGYLYYASIGCPTGGCPITSNPYLMVPLGGWFGYSLFLGKEKTNR